LPAFFGHSEPDGCPRPLPGTDGCPTVARSQGRVVQSLCATPPAHRTALHPPASGPFWYGKWSRNGRPVIRALGRAWVEPDRQGAWRRRRGRAPVGTLTEAQAAARMLEVVRDHDIEQTQLEADDEERGRRGVTFRAGAEWMPYLEHEKGAKPSTLRDYRWLLAEPGQAHGRGSGRAPGLMMSAFGDRPARELTTRMSPSICAASIEPAPRLARQQAPPSDQCRVQLRDA